jgi:hypothetical protein
MMPYVLNGHMWNLLVFFSSNTRTCYGKLTKSIYFLGRERRWWGFVATTITT